MHAPLYYSSHSEVLSRYGVDLISHAKTLSVAAKACRTNMASSVNKSAPVLVAPAEPTPTGRLLLSNMDRAIRVRIPMGLMLVYKEDLAPAKPVKAALSPANVIKAALSRTLVPYYPVAGRLVDPSPGKPEVECTGEGVWFFEASASCSLEDVNNLERPLALKREELLPFAPPQVKEGDLILMMQVTNFTCGGFAVGVRFNHTVFDGVGIGQFIRDVSEFARGHTPLAVDPVWCREAIPAPPHRPRPDPATLRVFRFETAAFNVSADHIALAKDRFSRETGHECSTFDVVTAMAWQARTRAIAAALPPSSDVFLTFSFNARHLLRHLLRPEGFYGNCVYPVPLRASGERVASATLAEVVELILGAKRRMADEFSGWVGGDSGVDPHAVPLDYGTMAVAEWRRIGLEEADYGWGNPMHVMPMDDDCNFVPSCFWLPPTRPMQGVKLLTRFLEEQHVEAFRAELTKITQS